MDDDILGGQQPGKREEGGSPGGREGLAVSHPKRGREGGKEEGREIGGSFISFFVEEAAASFKVRRSWRRFLQGFSRGRLARRPHSSQRAGQSTVVGPAKNLMTDHLIYFDLPTS